MQQFFNSIVHLFEAICRYSSFRYSELNILVYCLLVPALWCGIVWYRTRKLGCWLLALLVFMFFYSFKKQDYVLFSTTFYQKNIVALDSLGATTGLGYVGISLFIGVFIPLLFSLALVLLPKKILPTVYLAYLAINLGYYCWVFLRFA